MTYATLNAQILPLKGRLLGGAGCGKLPQTCLVCASLLKAVMTECWTLLQRIAGWGLSRSTCMHDQLSIPNLSGSSLSRSAQRGGSACSCVSALARLICRSLGMCGPDQSAVCLQLFQSQQGLQEWRHVPFAVGDPCCMHVRCAI